MTEHAGQRLRAQRERMGLTLRDVESAAARIAEEHRNEEFALSISRLSDIESKGVVPSVYRLYSLAVLYRLDLLELLRWYSVPLDSINHDAALLEAPRSHLSRIAPLAAVNVPLHLDPSFDPARTCNFGRLVERWGVVPLSFLSQFADEAYTYGYVGTEDFTMYPVILPGSFVQVDERRCEVAEGAWHSEYERPIYFIETREGFFCSWCSLKGNQLIIQPHPLSPQSPRIFRHPQDAEVLGQVVGIAMRFNGWNRLDAAAPQKQLSLAQ